MSSRSRWIFLVLAFIAAAVCVRLGLWQMDRLKERRAANHQTAEAREQPPVDLNSTPRGTDLVNRKVVARGTYDREHEIVLRGHVYRDTPGVWLVTPLRLARGDAVVLVVRGFVAAADAASPDLTGLDEPGEIVVRGVAEPIAADADSGGRNEANGRVTWRRLDRNGLAEALPWPVLDVAIRQSPDSSLPAPPHRIEPAELSDGSHLSYVVQWFAFATISLVGGLIMFTRRRDEHRRVS